jgi:hypothetical protein
MQPVLALFALLRAQQRTRWMRKLLCGTENVDVDANPSSSATGLKLSVCELMYGLQRAVQHPPS